MTAKTAVTMRLKMVMVMLMLSCIANAQLVPDFSATPVSGCSPVIVSFTDHSTGNPTQWRWDLGNGTTSTLQNPSTTYFNPGSYTVKLVIRNAAGTADSITKTQFITVYGKPSVNFTASPEIGCIPLLVQFNSQSTAGSGTITSWQWDFGDGTFATTQNPSHTYTASGNYNVSLRVTNNFGCVTSITKTQFIKIGTPVHADFTNSQPTSCDLPSTINFQNASTGAGTLSYLWSFGDGNTSTLANPSHTYTAAGNFTVKLTVNSSNGCTDIITKTNAVSIGIVHADFALPATVCVNSAVTFTNTSNPAPTGAQWDFGDGTSSTTISPSKTYTTVGLYQVRLISRFGNCADTAYKLVNVQPLPEPNFIGGPFQSCGKPFTVSFTNKSNNAISYVWDFGDGNTSTQYNATHTYTSYGTFNVTLTAKSLSGCTASFTQSAYVRIQAPKATILGLPLSDCAPLTHTFSSSVNSLDAVIGYQWDFGDGTTSTQATPTHTFADGTYDITLIVTTAGGCTDTVVFKNGITSSTKPKANFVATPNDVCAEVPVQFTDLTIGNVTRWKWYFGDGDTSNLQSPLHTYSDTGYMSIVLIVWNGNCTDTISFMDYVHIKPPVAKFSAGYLCRNKLRRFFDDLSLGADEWYWEFGDGQTSTQQNPVHDYAAPGYYTVKLTVKNHTTGCSYYKKELVKVMIEKAAFTESATVICRNTIVDFNSTGLNVPNVQYYDWDFGDGATATTASASHKYTKAGTYTVRLIITDILECRDTLIKNMLIHVDGPTAAFAPGSVGNCSLSATVFNDLSTTDGTHAITNWVWNYGDGNTINYTAPPFFHNYTTPGTFNVALKIVDSKGCVDSIMHNASVIVSKPVSAFATADTLSCPGKPISFTNSSTGPALNYRWDFGDGTSSTVVNPVHNYTSDGNYTVQLVIVDQYGCSDSTRRNVKIASPHATFAMSDSISTCPPLIVNFTNTSLNGITKSWDFGDGTSSQSDNPSHFYSYPGIYNVKLKITSNGGCISEMTKQVIVSGPKGNFTYTPLTGCSPLKITLTATTENRLSFVWDLNDGNILPTNDSVVTYTYTALGDYLPKMILVDAGGCQVPITGSDTIHVKGVAANFDFLSPTLCDKGAITFNESSVTNDGVAGYLWNFGDGQTSTQQNPIHLYTAPGFYTPSLIVTTLSGCSDTAIHSTPVKVVASPQALISNATSGCTPLTVKFNGNVAMPDTSAINSWNWDLGNGNMSTQQNPPAQLYTTPTTYNIKLTVTNSSGCTNTASTIVEAYRIPVVGAGNDALVCRGSGITLHASGADNYTWTPSTGLNCTHCQDPIASPTDVTQYIVTGTTIHGCTNIDTVKITVQQPFVMLNSPGDTLCKGSSVRLYAKGAYTYAWSPSAGLSSVTSATPIATPSVTTNYRVIGTDDKGCFKDTAYIPVKVFNYPTVNAGADQTINVGQSVELKPTISADVTNVIWSPTSGTVSNHFPNIVVAPKETTEYLVEATNAGGCKTRDNLTVFVLCNGSNVFIPNTFSPNGDGANDVFYPRGTGLFNIKTMRIYNRWGEVVYERGGFSANDASAGWDGKFKGVKLGSDVYIYTVDVLCDNKNILTLKGNVTLIL